jgi:hypothetical protein
MKSKTLSIIFRYVLLIILVGLSLLVRCPDTISMWSRRDAKGTLSQGQKMVGHAGKN